MSVRIALAWSPECEAELLANGFKKEAVYINYGTPSASEPVTKELFEALHAERETITGEQIKAGDTAFFRMKTHSIHVPHHQLVGRWSGLMSFSRTNAEVVVTISTVDGPPEMHRRRGEEGLKLANAADRMMWRDIEREFTFKAAMRGKAMIKKRAEKVR